MRPAFYGPLYRFLNSKIYCKRIIGVATADEKEIFCEKLANIVSKIDTTRTKEEIYKGISKRLKLVYTESIPSFGVGSRAMAGNNSLFIDKEDVDLLINGNEQEFLNNTVIKTIVHEAIHKLQFSEKPFADFYKGKSILGFIEGATELKAIERILRNKSHIDHLEEKRFNFASTPYNYAVAVMKQLEVIFGKEAVDRFAFRRDTKILDDLENLIGEKNYEALRSDLKIVGLNKSIKPSFENHQNSYDHHLCRLPCSGGAMRKGYSKFSAYSATTWRRHLIWPSSSFFPVRMMSSSRGSRSCTKLRSPFSKRATSLSSTLSA